MKRLFILTVLLVILCISISATDECTYLAKIAATAAPDAPFVVKVVFCEMLMNRVKHENFPNTLPAVCFSMGIRGKLKNPTADDIRAAALALHDFGFGGDTLYFEKCDKIKRTPPDKQSGMRLYDWYFYSASSI